MDYLKEGLEQEQIVAALSKRYGNSSEEIHECVTDVIELLKKERILLDFSQNGATLEEHCILDISNSNQLFSVLFETTYRCNEKCRHCYVCNQNDQELSLAEIKTLLRDLKRLNVLNLILTGGDVFCRTDFLDIFAEASALGFSIDIYTNGVLCDDFKVVEIARRHPRCIHFSIYSLDSQKHDDFTQVEGSLRKTLDTAAKFRDLGVAVNFKTTMLEMNYEEMPAIIDFARDFGASLQIGTVLRKKQDGTDAPLRLKAAKEIYMKTIPLISEKMNRAKDDTVRARRADSRICEAGFGSISVNPYGKVFACSNLPIVMGDIRKESIVDIWNHSLELKKWKESVWQQINGCAQCEMASICAYCPGIAMQHHNTPFAQYQDGCTLTEAVLTYINKK